MPSPSLAKIGRIKGMYSEFVHQFIYAIDAYTEARGQARRAATLDYSTDARPGLRPELQCSYFRSRLTAILLASAAMLQPNALSGDLIAVRHTEGLAHGFLSVRTPDGKAIADGQIMQDARGDRVTGHVIFRFKDGSVYDETTIFSQHGTFRLLSNHLIQKGPSFKPAMDTSIDASTRQVRVRYTDGGGKEKVIAERLELPPDLANGLLFTLVNDINPSASRTTVSWLATTPKPRLVKLAIVPHGEKPFTIGDFRHQAMEYVVTVETGGVAGFLAHLTGKQPPDMHIWVLEGEAPAFVKFEGPIYASGPIWRIQLAGAGVF